MNPKNRECECWCAVQLSEVLERVQRAVDVLEGATRRDLVDGYLPHMEKRRDGEWLEWDEVERAIEILRGDAPENPDSSPITTEQLDGVEYYDAVWRLVPWMSSVEHIEELVEAYCMAGITVSMAAEIIGTIYGGEHEQTE